MKKYIILILFPNLLFAQTELSLMDAIKIGMQENYDIQLSSKNKRISEINNNWANAGALPTINLSAKKKKVYLIKQITPLHLCLMNYAPLQ